MGAGVARVALQCTRAVEGRRVARAHLCIPVQVEGRTIGFGRDQIDRVRVGGADRLVIFDELNRIDVVAHGRAVTGSRAAVNSAARNVSVRTLVDAEVQMIPAAVVDDGADLLTLDDRGTHGDAAEGLGVPVDRSYFASVRQSMFDVDEIFPVGTRAVGESRLHHTVRDGVDRGACRSTYIIGEVILVGAVSVVVSMPAPFPTAVIRGVARERPAEAARDRSRGGDVDVAEHSEHARHEDTHDAFHGFLLWVVAARAGQFLN